MKSNFCTNCGAEQESAVKFCTKCGSPVRQPEAVAPEAVAPTTGETSGTHPTRLPIESSSEMPGAKDKSLQKWGGFAVLLILVIVAITAFEDCDLETEEERKARELREKGLDMMERGLDELEDAINQIPD